MTIARLCQNHKTICFMQKPTKPVTGRMESVQTPVIPVVADMISQTPGTISLGQGVVFYGPPPSVFEQLKRLDVSNGIHRYGDTGGIEPLRDIIKNKLQNDNNIDTDNGSRIIVTAGSNMAFLNALFAITNPGDEIILVVPYYFNHEMAIRMLSCKPVLVSTDDNYYPTPDDIKSAITPETRAVVTISPNNPSGVVYPENLLGDINTICRDYGIYHINDEAYEYFTYDNARHFSPGSIKGAGEYTISLYSMSKAYGFAHWRIGYMVLPEQLTTAVYKAQDTNLICPAIASQYAAIGALETGKNYCLGKLDIIKEVRTIMLSHLDGIKSFCQVSSGNGAFYFLIKIDTEMNDMTVIEHLIKKHKVAVLPGSTFGLNGCYLRVAYGALDKNNAFEGIKRLGNGLKDIIL